MLKQFVLVLLFILFSLPIMGQSKTDTFVFRFRPGNDILYIPWKGNENSMEELLSAIKKNRDAIDAGNMFLLVSSHATSPSASIPETSTIASTRRKRTKTEIMKSCGLKDMNFVTELTFSEPYENEIDVVVITLPASIEKVARLAGLNVAERVIIYNQRLEENPKKESPDDNNPKQQDADKKVRAEVEQILNIDKNKTDSVSNTATK